MRKEKKNFKKMSSELMFPLQGYQSLSAHISSMLLTEALAVQRKSGVAAGMKLMFSDGSTWMVLDISR